MMIIGTDYHPSFQQIAFLIEETGEYDEQRLNHEGGEAERFYRELKRKGIRVRVGMEATGYSRWFERLLAELDFELWIGDPAEIKAKRVKKRKTDCEDARLLLRLGRASAPLPSAGQQFTDVIVAAKPGGRKRRVALTQRKHVCAAVN